MKSGTETEARDTLTHTANTLHYILVVYVLNIKWRDKQTGVSPPWRDKRAERPGGRLRFLRKHGKRDERRHQEQQAGAGAHGAVAVVALAAFYDAIDGRFDLRTDDF